MWSINSLGLGTKLPQLEKMISSSIDCSAILSAKAGKGFKNPFSARTEEL